jgi:anti-sigma regulatory factor (Ser/Thr protein kinase)
MDPVRTRFAEISAAFPTVPESVAAARRFVAASLRRFGFEERALERAVLLASELVANAYATGRPPIRLRVRSIDDTRALVEVTHTGTEERDLAPMTDAARTVVEALADRWGSRPAGDGTVVWIEVSRVDEPAGTDRAPVGG